MSILGKSGLRQTATPPKSTTEEKVMLKQLDVNSTSIETMTLYNSLKNKVGENTKVEVPRDKLRVNISPS
jgi:hypothetical protein